MKRDRLHEIRGRASAATRGPWDTGPKTAAGYVWVYARWDPLLEPIHSLRRLFSVRRQEAFTVDDKDSWAQKAADADFIAQSRTDVPDLCDALESAWARIARLERELEKAT
jgi:hypothetical protein